VLGPLLVTPSCAGFTRYSAPVQPPLAAIFIHIKAPLTVDVDYSPAGAAVKKTSQQSTFYLHDWILTGMELAWDEAAIADIAERGGIEEVSYADYEYLNVLGLFASFTINVYGN
jgi:hypothetical protein